MYQAFSSTQELVRHRRTSTPRSVRSPTPPNYTRRAWSNRATVGWCV